MEAQERDKDSLDFEYKNIDMKNWSVRLLISSPTYFFSPGSIPECEMWNTLCCEEGAAEVNSQRRVGLTLSASSAPRSMLGLFLTTALNEDTGAWGG